MYCTTEAKLRQALKVAWLEGDSRALQSTSKELEEHLHKGEVELDRIDHYHANAQLEANTRSVFHGQDIMERRAKFSSSDKVDGKRGTYRKDSVLRTTLKQQVAPTHVDLRRLGNVEISVEELLTVSEDEPSARITLTCDSSSPTIFGPTYNSAWRRLPGQEPGLLDLWYVEGALGVERKSC